MFYAGLGGALLVMTGLWHATEWMMDGRRPGTLRLVPVGLVYLVLGALIALVIGGDLLLWLGLGAALVGAAAAFWTRKTSTLRGWVTWTFILLDLGIIAALGMALLG